MDSVAPNRSTLSPIRWAASLVNFDLGVIAGNRSYNPVFSAILGPENDGKVSVASTRVDGMKDFLVVPRWHPLLMLAPEVVVQVVHYLDAGAFRR
jgi:hypothetical protein